MACFCPGAQGRDLERLVLAKAVRWHLEDRVIVHNNKTVRRCAALDTAAPLLRGLLREPKGPLSIREGSGYPCKQKCGGEAKAPCSVHSAACPRSPRVQVVFED